MDRAVEGPSAVARPWRADGPHPEREAANRRVPELDALRGLAALVIVAFHVNPRWLPFGWAAVDLFFVLSGYLITAIILREGGGRGFLATFYLRRGLRTWPIYYLTLAALVALAPALPRPFRWRALPAELAYVQGLPHAWDAPSVRLAPYVNHTWSLAIEEQFYLAWPALVLLAGRRPGRVAVLALACATGSALVRARGVAFDCLLGRADGLALGGLLAVVVPRIGGRGRGAVGPLTLLGAAGAGLGLLGTYADLQPGSGLLAHPGAIVLGVNLAGFALIGAVASWPGHPAWRPLRLGPLRSLGRISYGLYLYHFPLLLLGVDLARALGVSGKLQGVKLLSVAAAFGLAWLSWRFLEGPLLARKDHLAYRRSRPAASGVAEVVTSPNS